MFSWGRTQRSPVLSYPQGGTKGEHAETVPWRVGPARDGRRGGWSPSVGNGWAAVFVSPDDDSVTLRAYASFFEAGVRPAFLLVETLDGDPARAPLGLQVWVSTGSWRVPTPEEAGVLLELPCTPGVGLSGLFAEVESM